MNALVNTPAIAPFVGQESAESYYQRRLDEASASGLKRMLRTPGHFARWVREGDDTDTKTLAFGRALHCATLEPDVFARAYCVLPPDALQRPTAAMLAAYAKGTASDSSKERVEWWQQWEADNAGRINLSANDYDRV